MNTADLKHKACVKFIAETMCRRGSATKKVDTASRQA
jgi:hypothetical protein